MLFVPLKTEILCHCVSSVVILNFGTLGKESTWEAEGMICTLVGR